MAHSFSLRTCALFLLLIFSSSSCTSDFDDNISAANPIAAPEIIKQNSDLFALITKVTTPSENVLNEIVCIDFLYPVSLQIYDEDLNVIGIKILSNDAEFSAFLGTLPDNLSLSISYPISTVVADESTFSVNNNSELKLAIESCSQDDIVNYFNGLFGGNQNATTRCAWKVPYTVDGNNTYAGGIFETNYDGSLKFTFKGVAYNGTWNFLFLNDEFHMNINLEGDSEVASDWNIDRKTVYSGTGLRLTNSPKDYVLEQSCESQLEYAIGETGPSGGIVFYDKGFYSLGWRYIEVAAKDSGFFEWGCLNSDVAEAIATEIGSGLLNTAAIVNFHDQLSNYYLNPAVCNVLNNGTVAAQEAVVENFGHYTDWYLPSAAELQLIYQNVHLAHLGNFAGTAYWTSTQASISEAKTVNFSSGETLALPKISASNIINTRVIRYF